LLGNPFILCNQRKPCIPLVTANNPNNKRCLLKRVLVWVELGAFHQHFSNGNTLFNFSNRIVRHTFHITFLFDEHRNNLSNKREMSFIFDDSINIQKMEIETFGMDIEQLHLLGFSLF
jgi:hypothetical protein